MRFVENRPRKGSLIVLGQGLHMSIPADMRPPRGLLFKLLDALLSDLHFLLGHALEGLLSVLMHVDVELVKKVFGLDIRSIFL